jgi:hypothetical protein
MTADVSGGSAGNTRLRSARQGLGLRSQQALAEAVTRAAQSIGLRLSVTARTVRRWESDNPPWPQPDHQAALEALFRRPITDLGFAPPWESESHADSSGGDGQLSSHDHDLNSNSGFLVSFPSRPTQPTLPGTAVTEYLGITASHRRLYFLVPGTRLHKAVAAHADLGTSMLNSVPESSRTHLAESVAESSLLAGRIEFFDLRLPEGVCLSEGWAIWVCFGQAVRPRSGMLAGS